MSDAVVEIRKGHRFAFGANWQRFLDAIDEDRISAADASLVDMLGAETLAGARFLDIGSGSGLFSLAARRRGAQVQSFDFDPMSVECARELRRRSDTDDSGWQIRQGSILDDAFVSSLGTFDIVYAWGVLHHTGALDTAMGNAAALVDDGGHLYISIYNYQALQTEIWTWVKRKYNTAGPIGRAFALTVAAAYLFGRGALARGWHAARRADRDPETRGMNLWRDAVDWAGGWPFEARRPEDVFQFFHDRGFELERLRTHMGSAGCNEFVFRRSHS